MNAIVALDVVSAPVGERERASILIVDDRDDKRLALASVLDELEQNLYGSSGEDALRQVLQRDFAVILLDVNMPGLTASRQRR
jgi:CheY-like chemotaxis protein